MNYCHMKQNRSDKKVLVEEEKKSLEKKAKIYFTANLKYLVASKERK